MPAPILLVLKTAYCSASHDSSCIAYQMLITQCIASQPETCYPWLHQLMNIRSRARTCSPNGRISFLYFCPRIFSSGVIRVSLLTLYLVRIHAACLIVHGRIGECVVTVKDWILSLITARYVTASPRTVETAFSCSVALIALCFFFTAEKIRTVTHYTLMNQTKATSVNRGKRGESHSPRHHEQPRSQPQIYAFPTAGHKDPVDGHIGRNAMREGVGGEDGGEGARTSAETQ